MQVTIASALSKYAHSVFKAEIGKPSQFLLSFYKCKNHSKLHRRVNVKIGILKENMLTLYPCPVIENFSHSAISNCSFPGITLM